MSQPHHRLIHIAGLPVNVYTSTPLSSITGNVAVFFFLHGRSGSAADLEPKIQQIFNRVEVNKAEGGKKQERELVVVTFDQRNHGHRLVDESSIGSWVEGNPNHAVDMYAMFVGTAKDVSYLIDFLPAYLFPSAQATIDQWLVGGISLGGHSTWWLLRHEPRVSMGIPIIGCPNYTHLITTRASTSNVPLTPPTFPPSFLAYLQDTDAVGAAYSSDVGNPYRGKKILVLSGADDTLVPWVSSEEMVNDLNVGVKKVIVYPGVGHEVPEEMIKEAGDFIWEWALSVSV
ncbi:Alpha/Beta hydrolase protein [Irpex rosettiformis]|uniref:Alpha/Beta hydrolase protein n=1 Tax=Irpex rosettiformis TaxID=378272 RepID=A0ACB8UFT8_9APHY|nr:Alpha/Beta hydrolase protein [Irpex rosettiformis]